MGTILKLSGDLLGLVLVSTYKNVLWGLKGWIQVWEYNLWVSKVFLIFGKLVFVKYHHTIYIKNQRFEIYKMVPISLTFAKNY